MITESFDNKSEAKINPKIKENREKCDACIITFSNIIEEYVVKNFQCEEFAKLKVVTGPVPVYKIKYKNKTIAFYKTYMGAPTAVGVLEDATEVIDTNKFIVFGGAGCLNKEIAHGKIMVPTYAYRDEGTSYHYAKPSDYIEMKNHHIVSKFMENQKLPFVEGKTWTTDAFYRETLNNIEKRKNDGCISVEMECSAMQAACDFRNLQLYYFLTSGDLLDSPIWDERKKENDLTGTQHDSTHFDIALELATSL
ncbi:MAG: nucleoside phosphorylase [Clostridia bacterium]|nr:nucleoside phosphorylase [Clostridia bacterium]